MNTTQKLVYDVYQKIISDYQDSNKECHLLSDYLLHHSEVLGQMTPKSLLAGYTALSLDKRDEDLQTKLVSAFGTMAQSLYKGILQESAIS